MSKKNKTKCGKVVFMGEANVGKSSLLNVLVGEVVSIVTGMAGTTRESVRGVLSGDGWQIIFLDTPGMDKKMTRDGLQKFMSKTISGAVAECDIICYVLDALDIRDEYIQKIKNLEAKKPVIVVVNKTDKTNFEKLYPWLEKLNSVRASVVPCSSKTGKNIDLLISEIVKLLPEGEPEFDADEYTDQSAKKMCAEIIRCSLIEHLHAEVPHGVAVQIVKWREKAQEVEIDAEIVCAKPSHKPIIIGKGGAMLKKIGISARKKIEELMDKHIRLNTHVLVRESWRDAKDVKKYLNSES